MRSVAVVLCSLLLVGACGDDGGSGGEASGTSSGGTTGMTGPMSGTGATSSAGSSGATGSGVTGMTTNVDSGTTETGTTGIGSSDTGVQACRFWEITYDLEGSTFEISDTPFNAGDQINTLTMPYDADDTVGPGTFVLRFVDVDGEPGEEAVMVSYEMGMHFLVDSGLTTVQTDLEADAGPDECGLTTGTVNGTTVTWMPSAIVNHHSMGQILCDGNLCGTAGLPNGMPVPQDETTDQPISDFEFSNDFSTFTMAQTVIGMDANSSTAWTYSGTETDRTLVDGPACLCR